MAAHPPRCHQQSESDTHCHLGWWGRNNCLEAPVARSETRPVVLLRSTAGTGHTYVTRKNRRNDPDRLELRKYDPASGGHVLFREVR